MAEVYEAELDGGGQPSNRYRSVCTSRLCVHRRTRLDAISPGWVVVSRSGPVGNVERRRIQGDLIDRDDLTSCAAGDEHATGPVRIYPRRSPVPAKTVSMSRASG